jgi:electron transport complex protein RnfB
MNEIWLTTLIITAIGLVCGVALAIIARRFAVKEDDRVVAVEQALPGVNSGGCGYAGCAGYAKAIIAEGAPINKCGPGGPAVVAAIAALTGQDAAPPEPVMAFIKCGGDRGVAKRRSQYNGVTDCAVANIVAGGWKECQYGCLGFGSCARVCNYGAIAIRNGLAIVDPKLCVGCGMFIAMVPVAHKIHVCCSSPEKGAVVRKICSKGCIGCGICVKLEGGVSMEMAGALARVDYAKPPVANEGVVDKCPVKCIVKLS